MGNRFGFQWLIGLLMIAMVAAVGVFTYNAGVAHGIAEGSRAIAVAPGAGVPVVAYWPRPWGFGFFPFFPFMFILFWFVVLRGLCWRGRWYGRGYGGVPPAFDEWHRRAHAEQGPPVGGPEDPRHVNI
jgi:hypothetical protein